MRLHYCVKNICLLFVFNYCNIKQNEKYSPDRRLQELCLNKTVRVKRYFGFQI